MKGENSDARSLTNQWNVSGAQFTDTCEYINGTAFNAEGNSEVFRNEVTNMPLCWSQNSHTP
jgi:hypothetical protein